MCLKKGNVNSEYEVEEGCWKRQRLSNFVFWRAKIEGTTIEQKVLELGSSLGSVRL